MKFGERKMNKYLKQLAESVGIKINPRRPYDDDDPGGYVESDNDFIGNNRYVVLELLEGEALTEYAEALASDILGALDEIDKESSEKLKKVLKKEMFKYSGSRAF